MILPDPPACDVLLFTAVSEEKKAVRDVARELGLQHVKGKSKLGDYVDLGTIGISRVLRVETHMGPFSSTGSAAKALQWLAATQARAIIGVGMAFGTLPKSQNHGDVLVSTSLLPYDYKIIRCGPSEPPVAEGRGTVRTALHRMQAFIQSLGGKLWPRELNIQQKEARPGGKRAAPVADYRDVKTYPARPQLRVLFEQAARLPDWHGRVHFGPLLSGASRIHCSTYRDELCAAFPDRGIVVGGDMEGIGLLASSDETESRWIIVKGISDFADEERDKIIDKTRPIACCNAAQFVLSALLREEMLRAQP